MQPACAPRDLREHLSHGPYRTQSKSLCNISVWRRDTYRVRASMKLRPIKCVSSWPVPLSFAGVHEPARVQWHPRLSGCQPAVFHHPHGAGTDLGHMPWIAFKVVVRMPLVVCVLGARCCRAAPGPDAEGGNRCEEGQDRIGEGRRVGRGQLRQAERVHGGKLRLTVGPLRSSCCGLECTMSRSCKGLSTVCPALLSGSRGIVVCVVSVRPFVNGHWSQRSGKVSSTRC